MKFALVNNLKTQATKGVHGTCLNCGSQMIANCGPVKIHHWAHNSIRNCDHWWEDETAWHRQWKNKFPKEWQEISLSDEKTGERHIADIRTEHDFIIEFQHSFINPEERISRENFYKNMAWVIDGTRLKRDYPRFLKGKDNFRKTKTPNHYYVDYASDCFPSAWIGSSVPVIFDFLGMKQISGQSDLRDFLFCLLPNHNGRGSIVAVISRLSFVDNTIKGLLFKKQDKQSTQINNPVNSNKTRRRKIESQYLLEKGRWKKRKRL